MAIAGRREGGSSPIPDQTKSAHAYRLQIGIPRGDLEGSSEDLRAYELGHDGGRVRTEAGLGRNERVGSKATTCRCGEGSCGSRSSRESLFASKKVAAEFDMFFSRRAGSASFCCGCGDGRFE